MPKYKFRGKEFSLEEVTAAAEKRNLTVDQYINQFDIEVIQDQPEVIDFQTGPAKETANVGPQDLAVNMVSPSADTSLVLQDGIKTQEESTWLEDVLGKNTIGVDFISDIYRAAKQGWTQGSALDASLALYSKGADMTDQELKDLIQTGRDIEAVGQTDEQLSFNKKYEELQKEYGGIGAFFAGWWENPTAMTQYTASSFANMARSLENPEAWAAGAGGAAAMAGTGAAVGSFAPGIGNLIGGGVGTVSGFMGGLSAVMETGATTAQLLQESAEEKGMNWAEMSDKQRFDWVKEAVSDEESFNNIKSKALARGLTIGAIDAITGAVTGGAGKTARMAVKGSLAGAAEVATMAAVETAGGLASEIGGQLAAGQELNAQEILTEGFADKTFTTAKILQGGLKGPTYKINGETLSGKTFAETIKIMDDAAVVEADITISNDPVMEKIISNRREDIQIDLDTDARVNNADDRAKIIELQRKLNNLKNNNTVSGSAQKSEATQQIKDILEKYKDNDVDVDIQQRQEAVAKARKNALENNFNKNVKKVTAATTRLGFKQAPKIVDGPEQMAKAIAEDTGLSIEEVEKSMEDSFVEGVYAGDGRIYIDKKTALEQGNVNVSSHELLHAVLNALVGSKEKQGEIVTGIKGMLNKTQLNWVNNELEKNYDPAEYDTEFLTVFSNGIQNGDIKYDETVFDQIKQFLQPLLQKLGFENINFDSAKGVYNFLKEYNTTINSETGLSKRAFQAIEKAEVKKDSKVSEAPSIGVQASKKLAPEISTQVAEQITEIKNLQKEGKALAEKFNKEFIKSPKQTRIEQQLSENIAPALDALAESTTKRLYDPIAPDAKRSVSRQDYKDALKANWTSMVINEFDPAKQDVEAFLSTRGNLRANSLAKELGIEGVTEGGIKADVTEQKALTTEDTTEAGIDEGIEIARREAKLINPVDLIQDENLRKKYINAVKAKLKDLNVKGLSFKTLKDLAPEVTAELFNIPVKKVTEAAANLSTGDLSTIQNFINKNADLLLKLLPEGGIDQNQAASEKLLGTSTGVPKKLLDAFYDPKPRGTKGAGLAIQNKRKGITRREFLETFGIVDGKKLEGLSPRGPEAQAMKGLVSLFGRMMTNTVVRQELSKKKDQQLVYNASPKSFEQLGERTGLIFLATDKREAQAYAEMNRGEVRDIYINKPEVATEKEALAVMKELGIDTTEGNLYELIDPRFEDFYIGKEAMDQVTSALADRGFKAIRYEDGGQVSQTTESIVVFDKSAISETKTEGVEADIQDIAAGKSQYQFSKKKRKERSKKYGLENDYYDVNTPDGIKKYINDLETYLLPIFGPEFIKPFMFLDRNVVGSKITKKEFDNYRQEVRKKIAQYKKDNPKVEWEIQKMGKDQKKSKKYFGLGMTSPEKDFGITPEQIQKNIDNGNVALFNQKYNSIFDEMWFKIEEAVAKDPKAIIPIQIYLASATYVTEHPLRRGAEFVFYSDNPKGLIDSKGKKRTYEYEHAVQSHYLRDKLLDAVMQARENKDVNFKEILQKEKENYKLIALDANDNKKLTDAGYQYKMPVGFKNWWQRYFNQKVAKEGGGIDPNSLKSTIIKGKSLSDILKIENSTGLQLSKKQPSKREKTLDKQFNDILENKTGIASDKEYSEAKAKVVGANKGKFNWFIPPTAEDFVGLLYQFLSKGSLGDKQMAWFKVNLLDPYARAMSAVSRDRNTLARNYRALKKELKIVPKNLKKEVPGEGFTIEQAVRVYIWTKQGYDIPGLSDADAKPLRAYINSKPELKEFADKLILLNKNEYAKPKAGWDAGTITTDMLTALNENVRATHLQEWQENVDVIFSEKNLNKIEAAYGSKFRYALENILTRMKTGRNRTYGTDSLTGRLTDWLTNSIGAIMFFNTRSAILQTISSVNFINFTDNNPIAAAKAFANPKQYWSDFLKLYNSDFLVDRRDGLRLNVNESDIADMAKKGGVRGVISELLKLGFTPTQIADSFAIASGGATFYRNRLKTYLKEGMDEKTAEEKAFQDFRETAEESQQSSRPDRISQQQAGPLGRIILAFANTPAQYARLMKKAFLDLKDGRGDAKTNISKLIYYGAVQNLVFTAMQQALFGIMFGDEEEEDEDKTKKAINVANGMADSILRGMGISGAIVSVLKNTVKKLIERSEKRSPDYAENAVAELLKISPPISSKASKIKNALRSYEWDKDEMYKKGLALENPAYLAAGNIVSAATNVPLDRAVKKVTNVKNAMDEDLQLWQRIALLGGWSEWELGIKEKDKKSKSTLKKKKLKKIQRKK